MKSTTVLIATLFILIAGCRKEDDKLIYQHFGDTNFAKNPNFPSDCDVPNYQYEIQYLHIDLNKDGVNDLQIQLNDGCTWCYLDSVNADYFRTNSVDVMTTYITDVEVASQVAFLKKRGLSECQGNYSRR